MFYIAHKQNKTKKSVETGFMVILYFKCKTVILQGHFYFWVTKYYQCQMYILDCILQICSMSWPITIMRSREPCIIYNVIWNSNNISVLNVVILSSVACPSLPLHFRLEHVIVFKQQPYMRQFTACSVLKEKTPTVTSLPLHFLHALLPRVSWSFVLFAFSLHGWERRTCADYFTEFPSQSLPLPFFAVNVLTLSATTRGSKLE